LRHFLGAALFYAGEYTRAASLLDVVGRACRKYLPPDDSYVLDCAYHAGHAYAEIGKPDKTLPQLRFYVQNADTSADGDATSTSKLAARLGVGVTIVAGHHGHATGRWNIGGSLRGKRLHRQGTSRQLRRFHHHLRRVPRDSVARRTDRTGFPLPQLVQAMCSEPWGAWSLDGQPLPARQPWHHGSH
jgi:hypothetical protein